MLGRADHTKSYLLAAQFGVDFTNCESTGIFPFIEDDDELDGTPNDSTIITVCCRGCIQEGIDDAIMDIINHGGDNPLTEQVEVTVNNDVLSLIALTQAEGELDNYLNFAIYLSDLLGDDGCAEVLIAPIRRWHWKQKLYGRYLKKGDVAMAETYLNGMVATNESEQFFIDVQQVNIKRIKQEGGEEIEITEEDLKTVLRVAESAYPASGYGRTLHRILTGINLPVPEYEIPQGIAPRSKKIEDISMPRVYPNPTRGLLQIVRENWKGSVKLELMTIEGQKVIEKELTSDTVLDVSELSQGVYLMRMELVDGTKINEKIVIQK